MAYPTTPHEFLQLLEKSELVEKARIGTFVKAHKEMGTHFATPKECALAMIQAGMITKFQASLLLQGKWRNFFLSGKYKVLEHLGAGGMGTVFLCEHRHMRRRVAIKLLPPDKSQAPGSIQRFLREAQAVARLNHPNIVRAHDIDCDGTVHFLVMEFVDGISLQDMVDGKGPLSIPRAINYIAQTANGLQHAHEGGLVHRDVKPSNLLLDRQGVMKILDLGLARFAENADNLTLMLDSKIVLGTADYLAPEQARDSAVDTRADIYSLGAVGFFFFIGKPMFDGGGAAQKLIWHQTKTPPRVDSLRPEVPAGVADVIVRMLSKNPNDRYDVPGEVVEALRPWLQEMPPPSLEEMPAFRYTHHRDVDTMARLSTVATMSPETRAKILESSMLAGVGNA